MPYESAPFQPAPTTALPERAVAALWSRAHTLSDGLVTEDGRRLTVVYPGRPNARAGPDFMDAVIQDASGRRIVGDVELHVDAPDWYGHRHHLDPAYNGVVLHVVLRSRGSTASRQQSGTETPVAALPGGRLDAAAAAPSPALDLPGPRGLEDLLDRAGADRFIARSDGFRAELASDTADQVLYRALMEALGYASNRKPFRRLASLVPHLGPLRTKERAAAHQGAVRPRHAPLSLRDAAPRRRRDGAPGAAQTRKAAPLGARHELLPVADVPCETRKPSAETHRGGRAPLHPVRGERAGLRAGAADGRR